MLGSFIHDQGITKTLQDKADVINISSKKATNCLEATHEEKHNTPNLLPPQKERTIPVHFVIEDTSLVKIVTCLFNSCILLQVADIKASVIFRINISITSSIEVLQNLRHFTFNFVSFTT